MAPRRSFGLLALLSVPILVHIYLLSGSYLSLSPSSSQSWPEADGIGQVHWGTCTEHALPGIDCGYIAVPTNYANHSEGITKVALGRRKASKLPRRGIVLYNPGGPGGTGKWMLRNRGDFIATFIGDDYDIIGFDPRGVGDSTPRVNCFDGAFQDFKHNTVLDRGYDIGPNVSDSRTREHLLHQNRYANAMIKTAFDLCNQTMGETLKDMGSTTVARDIDFMTTHLAGPDALINYYGMSYGSILGQYLVNMFPKRIGRVALDGIINANHWANRPAWISQSVTLTSAHDTYRLFLRLCSEAGPNRCALASNNENPDELNDKIDRFFEQLYFEPMPAPLGIPPRAISSGSARMALFAHLHVPKFWASIAAAFSQAMDGNPTLLANSIPGDFTTDLERSAVTCNDQLRIDPAPTPEKVVDASLNALANITKFAMSILTTEPDHGCEHWPVKSRERYAGPWNHTLSNPILLVSNTADPATPIDSAREVQASLGASARLLTIDSPGHTSKSLYSKCFTEASLKYWATGELPPEGVVCPVDEDPFDGEHLNVVEVEGAAQHVFLRP